MKLKGKAIFELTNVETGEKRVVKEENMVTNAFQHLVQSEGMSVGGPQRYARYYNNASSYFLNMEGNGSHAQDTVRRYTNGLALFEGQLQEDPEHIYVTADDPELTGAGGIVAYIGANTQGGSYNKTESGPIENGYKHVWDFTTSQGNGDIGCACLTTLMGGGLGAGSGFITPSTDWYGSLYSEFDQYYSHSPVYLPPTLDCFQFPIGNLTAGYIDLGRNLYIRHKNYFAYPYYNGSRNTCNVHNEEDINGKITAKYVFDRSFIYTKYIDLDVFRFPYNSFSLFDKSGHTYTNRKYNNTSTMSVYDGHCTHLRTVRVNMPQGLINLIPEDKVQESATSQHYFWPTDVNFDEGFMYISFIIPTGNSSSTNSGCTLDSGGKIYVWKINMNTFESSYFTITNTTGQSIKFRYDRSAVYTQYKQVIINNDYTILMGNPEYMYGPFYIIDNATGSTITQVVNASDDSVYTGYIPANFYIRNNMLYGHDMGSSNTAVNKMYVINLKTGRLRTTYTKTVFTPSSDTYTFGRTYGTPMPLIIRAYSYYSNGGGSTSYVWLIADPQLLMTINNLEDTVTKTSAETMKVTYIITQEAEE